MSQHADRVAKRVQNVTRNNIILRYVAIVWLELANAALTMLGYIVLKCSKGTSNLKIFYTARAFELQRILRFTDKN